MKGKGPDPHCRAVSGQLCRAQLASLPGSHLCRFFSLLGENVPVTPKGDFGRMFLPDMIRAPKPCWWEKA